MIRLIAPRLPGLGQKKRGSAPLSSGKTMSRMGGPAACAARDPFNPQVAAAVPVCRQELSTGQHLLNLLQNRKNQVHHLVAACPASAPWRFGTTSWTFPYLSHPRPPNAQRLSHAPPSNRPRRPRRRLTPIPVSPPRSFLHPHGPGTASAERRDEIVCIVTARAVARIQRPIRPASGPHPDCAFGRPTAPPSRGTAPPRGQGGDILGPADDIADAGSDLATAPLNQLRPCLTDACALASTLAPS